MRRVEPMATSGQQNKTRQQILSAARTVLAAVGYENITTRRITETAGVNIATLHYYFGTKEALLSEVLQTALDQALVVLRDATENAPTTHEAIHVLFNTAWQMTREQRGFLRYDVAVRGLRDERARQEAASLYQAFRRLNETILQRHIDAGGVLADGLSVSDVAHYMVGATDGVMLQFALTGDEEATRRSLDLIEQHVLRMLKESGADNEKP